MCYSGTHSLGLLFLFFFSFLAGGLLGSVVVRSELFSGVKVFLWLVWLMELYCLKVLVLIFGRVLSLCWGSSAGLRHGLSRGGGGGESL